MTAHPHETHVATYDDLVSLPENVVGELVDGELLVSPRPSAPHGRAAAVIGARLLNTFDLAGGWWIFFEPELHLVTNELVLVPDIAGWRRERMPAYPRDHRFEVTPDWVCEVLSPTTSRIDWNRKLPIYAAHGIPHVWFIDPIVERVQVMRLVAEGYVLVATFSADDKMRAEPFEELEIDLSALWPPSAPAA
jgi:Uma2 family endonuclease